MKKLLSFRDPDVAAVFGGYPEHVRHRLMALRRLIFDVAAATDGVGELEETLRWGQPSYLTSQTRSGSLIRIDQIKSHSGQFAMYFHCQTTLVDSFREMYREEFQFQGNRCIVFDDRDNIPVHALRHCIALALTYHLRKSAKTR